MAGRTLDLRLDRSLIPAEYPLLFSLRIVQLWEVSPSHLFSAFQGTLKLICPHRLAEVIVHPNLQALFTVALHGMGRQRYDVYRRLPLAEAS
jgi:hypothetical protein